MHFFKLTCAKLAAFFAMTCFSGAVFADNYYGNYCSATIYGSNWGVLIDQYASAGALCARIQNEFLYGRYPDKQVVGFYDIYGYNRVSVNCEGGYPLYFVRSGYGAQPFYDAYNIARSRGALGCIFSNITN